MKQYEKPQEWINIGDVNPQRHGGIFVRWNRDMWQIIETRHYADLPKGVSNNEHMFSHMWLEPMDIWVKGDPYQGFTERAIKQLNAFSGLPFDIMPKQEASRELPKNETYNDYVNWYLENEFSKLLPYFVHGFMGYLDGHPLNFESDYWGYLSHYGIEKENF